MLHHMKLKLIGTTLFSVLFAACINTKSEDSNTTTVNQVVAEQSIMDFYRAQMRKNYVTLNSRGRCEDALDDTLHERFVPYIESKRITDSTINIDYKLKEACCMEFLGDYQITNDTLKFEFEHVNGTVCSCICWYKYKLEIKNIKANFSEVALVYKR